MLFLAAFTFGRHSAAAMIHFAFLLALAWQIYAYERRPEFAPAGAYGPKLFLCGRHDADVDGAGFEPWRTFDSGAYRQFL
jgi:hypothetical protein